MPNKKMASQQNIQLQKELLDGVSRTFALTIPALPGELELIVGNAYLLCRIADTIEDSSLLDPAGVREFSERFIEVVSGHENPHSFAKDFYAQLRPDTPQYEKILVENISSVMELFEGFQEEPQAALLDCVKVMSRGMAYFQSKESISGLSDLGEHNYYCYVVAGCVGEMLTRLFVDYLPQLSAHREDLMKLSVSFGQALQMTNILKDFWEDRSRQACWLPRAIFSRYGVDLKNVEPGSISFQNGLVDLIKIAYGHAMNALEYIKLLPKAESGIRNFCLWALYMSVLTLKKLFRTLDYSSGNEVKISRKTVRNVVSWSRISAGSNLLVSGGFYMMAKGLPEAASVDIFDSTQVATVLLSRTQ